jgi:signal peptidase
MARRILGWLLLIISLLTLLISRGVGRYSLHAVLSGSMGRAVPRGSLVLTQPRESSYQLGDVISFPIPGTAQETALHRLVRIKEGGVYETKGDANPNGDPWNIPAALVRGRVTTVIPLVGYPVIAVRTKAGYICFTLLTLFFLIVPLMVRLRREWLVLRAEGVGGR